MVTGQPYTFCGLTFCGTNHSYTTPTERFSGYTTGLRPHKLYHSFGYISLYVRRHSDCMKYLSCNEYNTISFEMESYCYSSGKASQDCSREMYQFRCNLLKVSQSLSEEDVRNLVYISPECSEDVQSGREYFLQLEKKGLLTPSSYDYLLDRLTVVGREDVAIALMERICQSPCTSRTLCTHLLARLLASGKEDRAVQLMHHKCQVQQLPNKLSLPNQTLLLVFNAKEAICTRHKTAVAKLFDPTFLHAEVGGLVEAYFHHVLQSTKIDMEATVYQWPSLSVFEDSGNLGELLRKTLESIFSFTDAFRVHINTIVHTESIQLQSIKPSVKTCSMTYDNFIQALTDTEWNCDGREESSSHKKLRDSPLGMQAQSACKSIADLCEGLSCGRSIEEAEVAAKQDISIIDSGMYFCWYSAPMLQWLRTIIQMAASSRLDLTKYCEDIITVAAAHRETIIKYHSTFTQILGQDIMKAVDLVLNLPKHEVLLSESSTNAATSASDAFDHPEYMAVYWYLYLLQLVALACNSSSNPLELAKHFSSLHKTFQESSHTKVVESCMGVASKMAAAAHTRAEDLRTKAIQLCPKASAERLLLSRILPDLDTQK